MQDLVDGYVISGQRTLSLCLYAVGKKERGKTEAWSWFQIHTHAHRTHTQSDRKGNDA